MRPYPFTTKSFHLLLIAVFALTALFAPARPVLAADETLEITTITPNQAANDVDTPVVITGSGFAETGGEIKAFLGDTPLKNVAWVDATTLTAEVGWGVAPGHYDLKVVNGNGDETTLPAAFEATLGIDQWNSNAIDGGPVRNILPIAEIPGLIYAQSPVTSGVFRSIDYGETWETISHAGGQFFTYDPAHPATLYLNTLQSTDGGQTWNELLNNYEWPDPDQRFGVNTQVIVHPTIDGVLFIASADIPAGSGALSGLLRSTDSGATWVNVSGDLGNDNAVTAMDFRADGTILLGTRDGNIYQSSDGGIHWSPLVNDVLERIGLMKINPHAPDELWVTTHYQATANAKMAIVDLSADPITVDTLDNWPHDHYPTTLGFLDIDTVYIASNWDRGWLVSKDGGEGAVDTDFNPDDGKPGYSLALDPWDTTRKTFYIADERYGVQKTTDLGATWQPSNTGLHAMSPNFIEADPDNPSRVYAKIIENGWPGIFISDNGGQSWDFSKVDPLSTDQPVVSMLALNRGRIFVGAHGEGPRLYISDDQGTTWDKLSIDPATGYETSFHMPWVLEADPFEPDTLVMPVIIGNRDLTTDNYVSEVYRSTDNGDTWTAVGLAGQIGAEVNNLSYVAFDPNTPGVVYASADHYILKSVDHGLNWSVLLYNAMPWLCGSIAVEPVAPYRVYVGSLVSNDGGATWNDANFPFWGNQLMFVPNSDTLYLTGNGMSISYDGGTTWETPEGPLASLQINAIQIVKSGERTVVYIGTPGGEAQQAPAGGETLRAFDSASSLVEAGVYRSTAVRYTTFLPILRR